MARLYIDQVAHDLNAICGSGSANPAAFLEWADEEYDRRLGYRTMDALRNFISNSQRGRLQAVSNEHNGLESH
jgi:hypothetical protein